MARDLGFLAWKNDMAWMEGKLTKQMYEKENIQYQEALRGLEPLKLESMKPLEWKWRGWTIVKSGSSQEKRWTKGTFECIAWDADVSERFFAAVVQDIGYERFSIHIYDLESMKRIATIKSSGPHVCILNSTIVYLGSSKDLRYDSVCIWESKKTRTLYSLIDPTENLELSRAEDGSIYVLATDFVNVRMGRILETGIHWTMKAKHCVPLAHNMAIIDGHLEGIKATDIVESFSIIGGWYVTRSHGVRTLWDIRTNTKKLVVWGEIGFDVRDPLRLEVSDIRYEPYVIQLPSWKTKKITYPFKVVHDRGYFLILPRISHGPKALLVTAYGAYGSPTHIGAIQRWIPLIKRGWAIAVACVPGSGDHDIAWKESGQRQNRQNSISFLKNLILNLQEVYGISGEKTCLYGRSAGGLLVISTAIQNRGLVGALYVECPYVDVLRTISNPKLPLTLLETKEFGIGTNPADIIATGSWSPMERIPDEGIPEIFVIAHSDTADLEVYPYEVIKWIRRMRGTNASVNDYKKLLYVHNKTGHFTTTAKTISEDLALLENWISPDKLPAPRVKNHGTKYKMPMTKNKKNRSTRKNKKNHNNTSSSSNAPLMGGRRKSRGRSGRKSRRRH